MGCSAGRGRRSGHRRRRAQQRALARPERSAAEDPEVARLYEDLSRRRRADARLALDVLAEHGLLRRDVDVQRLADTVALLNGMDSYQLFVEEFGWSEDDLKRWWVDTTRRPVFAG